MCNFFPFKVNVQSGISIPEMNHSTESCPLLIMILKTIAKNFNSGFSELYLN